MLIDKNREAEYATFIGSDLLNPKGCNRTLKKGGKTRLYELFE